MHNKYIITYECHDNAKSGTIREIFWLLPVLSPLLPVVYKNHSYKHNEQINNQNINNSECFGVKFVKIYPEMTSQ
jgi:hypothetical protein